MASESTFSLASRSLKLTSAADIEPYLEPLRSSYDITTIILTGNTIGVPASRALAGLLSKQKSLHTIKFDDIYTSRLLDEIPPSLDALLTALLQCPKLESIDLSDNAFGLNTVEPLVKFLRQHIPLRHLLLNNNGLGPEAGALIADALTQLAQRKNESRQEGKDVPDLETIVCGRNRLESGSASAWAKAYQANSKVKTVRMIQNGIRPDGIVVLIRDGLSHCKELKTLDLQDNTLTVDGAKALANVIGSLSELEELGVGDALLKARGALALMAELSKSKHYALKTIKLQCVEMDKKGLKALVGAVTTGALPALQRTELNGNKFSEDDELVTELREILNGRRKAAGVDEDDEAWGIDELDEMESEDEDEDDEEEQEAEDETGLDGKNRGEPAEAKHDREKAGENIVDAADKAQAEPIAQRKDEDVDDLADALGKSII